jgi:hypothetical protein
VAVRSIAITVLRESERHGFDASALDRRQEVTSGMSVECPERDSNAMQAEHSTQEAAKEADKESATPSRFMFGPYNSGCFAVFLIR